jgi:O-antigen/teichoic acid export membrane protein
VTLADHREESAAMRGARWVTVAFLVVGVLNYLYALVLTHLLNVTQYSTFAAGQGLLLWATTVATVSVPWVLAQALARAGSDAERFAATRFTMLASAGSGLVAGAVVWVIGVQFASTPAALALAVSAFIIFLGTTTTGWFQGHERMRALSALYVGENVLKNAAGLLLVTVAGMGDTGALSGFGIGGLLLLVWWPRVPRRATRPWLAALASRDLWHRALGIAAVQGLVSLFAAIDVVFVAALPESRALAASYQVSAALSRAPLFVAGAVSTAFFPALARSAGGGALAARAVRMYAMVALPLATILATTPAPVLAAVFPAQYGAMATLLKFTAVAGLAAGGINMLATFFQAVSDFSCAWWLLAGVACYVAALLTGWATGGITGLAVGTVLGATVALVLLGHRFRRRLGHGLLARFPLTGPVITAVVLIVLRRYPVPWLVAAIVVGLLAAVRFLRHPGPPDQPGTAVPPGAPEQLQPEEQPETTAQPGTTAQTGTQARPRTGAAVPARRRETMKVKEQSEASLLTDAVWRGSARAATKPQLRGTLALARRNHVEGRLAGAYPEQLSHVAAEVRTARGLFARNLAQVTGRLGEADIPAVLVKGDLPDDCVRNDFDLVVEERHWDGTFTALAGWYVHSSTYWLERTTKALLFPPVGPALHLHTGISWFGVPVVPTEDLLEAASGNGHGCLSPAPVDELRIWLAHAMFQNLALDLSELFAVRDLLRPELIEAGRDAAAREGWRTGYDAAVAAARSAIDRLDGGAPLGLPVPLPLPLSLRAGAEHAYHMHLRGQHLAASRAAALRVALVAAKQRRRMLTR